MSSNDDPLIAEAIATLSDAVTQSRADVVHAVVTTAADSKGGSMTALRAILDHVSSDSGTCLHHATKLESVDIVRTLLASGANASIRDKNGRTCYDLAQKERMRNVYVTDLLQAVAHEGLAEHVKNLLASGVNVNATDGSVKANTALHWAASYASNASTIDVLCAHGAVVDQKNGDGATALHDAAKRGNVDVIKALIGHGASATIRAEKGPYRGKTPLDLLPASISIDQLGLPKDAATDDDRPHDLAAVLKASQVSLQNQSESSPPSPVLPSSSSSTNNGDLLPMTPQLTARREFGGDRSGIPCIWPPPQSVVMLEEEEEESKFYLPRRLVVNVSSSKDDIGSVMDVWRRAENWFEPIGLKLSIQCLQEAAADASVICHLSETLFARKESYKLTVTNNRVFLSGSDLTGLWYGMHTFIQLAKTHADDGRIPRLCITDWPDFSYRGVLVDLTGGRVPSLETMYGFVDILSAVYKYNSLELRMSDTRVSATSSLGSFEVYSSEELARLADYCRKQFLELVPHFELSFGESSIKASSFTKHSSNLLPAFSSKTVCLNGIPYLPFLNGLTKQVFVTGTESDSFLNRLALSRSLAVVPAKGSSGAICKRLSMSGIPSVLSVETGSDLSPFGCWDACASNAQAAAAVAIGNDCAGLLAAAGGGGGGDNSSSRLPFLPLTLTALAPVSYFAWNSQNDPSCLKERTAVVLNRHVFVDASNSVADYMLTFVGLTKNASEGKLLHHLIATPSDVKLKDFTAEIVQSYLRGVRQCHRHRAALDLCCFQADETKKEMLHLYDWVNYVAKVLKAIWKQQKADSTSSGDHFDMSKMPAPSKTDLANTLLEVFEHFPSTWNLRQKDFGSNRELIERLKRVEATLI
ncbi:uncharacterized protein [Oscarella lobularis]|uniref:uncharacterized protein isoform X2 n=1 Tax=Oscarella lobularis TaxID=121494 RepID=UPI003313ED14